jgi:hypothetical protein
MRGLLLFSLLLLSPESAADWLHHDLEVRLEPSAHRIEVVDRVNLPAGVTDDGDGELRFVLHAGLELQQPVPGYLASPPEIVAAGERFGINESGGSAAEVELKAYRLRPDPQAPARRATLELRYAGTIHHPLVEESEEYARSFSRTPGTIEPGGVVLSGSSVWLPLFDDELVTFRLALDLPSGWDAVSQGSRLRHEIDGDRRKVDWDSPEPMDEIYLVAAPFHEYARPAGEVTAFAFLREDDPNLAAKYLEATVQYIEMYRKLIGPYPYDKFALVENFWDTGFGMPSFTLLGPRIIRFPFILHSSYPHEILHNWWGNSVFVDYPTGNWCEGLTAYLADHLIREGQGRGTGYRRDTLKKYRNFVRGEKDFPLSEFRARHSSATEAVGYGKSLMLWHMLRRRVGDETFARGLARFYRDQQFRRAGFGDLQRAFSEEAGEDLAPFFRQWVERTGAPDLRLGSVDWLAEDEAGGELAIVLEQVQPGKPYRLDVPIALTFEGEAQARLHRLRLQGKRGVLRLRLPRPPERVDVDPQFDLFRRLDPLEVPPSLGQIFGAEQVALVLPASGGRIERDAWKRFAASWTGDDSEQVIVLHEEEIGALPEGRAVWVLGSDNRWASGPRAALAALGGGLDGERLQAGETELPREDHCFAFAVRDVQDPELALGWIGADNEAALPGLARKLPHYGKYSYVAFSGAEPTNVAKGQWPVLESPLVRVVGERVVERAALPAREPLARLEPVFDPQSLIAHVDYLASEELEGRGAGSEGLELAVDYVARAFDEAGLTPGGEDGSWFQVWTEPDGPGGEPVVLRNVIGVLPGRDPRRAGESVVIGAHVDHLGRGWPDVRSGEEGKLHLGADDNASGVAVLLELARLLGGELEPSRSIVFVAFSGEEWSLRGSKHYVKHPGRYPVSKMMAMINLDTVGRLGTQKITVFGTGSATEWIHIVMGVGFTTGIEARSVPQDLGGSDQKSFLDAGVPAIQIFTGAHEDYHRPGDRPEKLDAAGMVKVATFAREALVYLAERERSLTATLEPAAQPTPATETPPGGRRVSLGTLPEFSFPGPGVRVADVLAGTPAERAGLRPGDLILAIDDDEIADVRAYAQALRQRAPGETIRIRLRRDGEELELQATLVPR